MHLVAAGMSPTSPGVEMSPFVESKDTLFGRSVPSVDCKWFSNKPPLVLGAKNDKASLKVLKQKCHIGLPPQLRCALWAASVARVANPQIPIAETDAVGTVPRQAAIQARWSCALDVMFPNLADRNDVIAPDLGLGQDNLKRLVEEDYGRGAITSSGKVSLALVLSAVQQVLGIEYCPPLPDIATVLLTHMPEEYAFATIKDMINDTSHFLPVSQKDYYSWCHSYVFFVKRNFPDHYKLMTLCGALEDAALDPIFKRFFTTLLRPEDVLRFMDIFLVEGRKAVFRLALSILRLVSKDDMKRLQQLRTSDSFWDEIRKKTLHPDFSFNEQLKKMYPKFAKMAKRYPRRRALRRVIKFHEKTALDNAPIYVDQTPPKPLGFTSDGCALAKPAIVRSNLAKWLPTSLRATKLDLIYSTELNGRSLASLYDKCGRYKNTITLVEVLTGGNESTVVGMFATEPWTKNIAPFGDGECFLFRASPDAKCFKWTPDLTFDLESNTVREQFMVATNDYMAMGANTDGTHGLMLGQDLIIGESHRALGFENEPLQGIGQPAFSIGILEVYRFVREIDGKSSDDGKPIWDLSGM